MAQTAARLAKLSRPTLTGIASRERLFSRLDNFRESSIVWVSGPPGSGKTTLVADYLDTFALDYVWYQVDQGDADVATFFHYMSQALEARAPGSAGALPLFSPQYLNDLAAFTRRYFREFFAQLATPFALVFDNYQEVPAQSRFHEVVRDGLEEIPEGGYVVIIARTDPPSAFARLRANQQMMTLGWNELRLTREESDAIVAVRGAELADCEQLYDRTQGWAAGLVLMLEHMRSQGTVAEIPTTFTPDVIFDYLAGEVIKNFEEEQQSFLLQTSILPHMTAALARDLTGREDAGAILDGVARHDSFVTAKQSEAEVAYQYHPLLREFLQKRAGEVLGAERLSKLQARAATLLEEAGLIEDAIALRIDNYEWAEVARLIREHAHVMLEQGRGETLERWLEEVPRERLQKDPWLLYRLGQCRLPLAPRESRRQCEKAFELFRAQPSTDVEGLFLACAGVLGAILHDMDDLSLLDPWIKEVEALLEAYPDFPRAEYGEWATCHMYMALVLRQPFHADAELWAERTYGILQSTRDPAVQLQAAMVLVSGIVWTGRFAKATEIIESIRRLAERPQVSPFELTTLRMVESMYYMLDGQFDRCLEAVRDGMEIAESSGIHIWETSTLINGAGSALAANDLESAQELLDKAGSGTVGMRRFDSYLYNFFSAWLALLKGDVLEAYQRQRAAQRLASDVGVPFFEILGGIGLAQILFECGDQRKGAMYLREVRRVAKTIKNRYLEFTSLLVYAAIAMEHGRQSSGLNALEYALRVGREMGYSSIIWWQPKMMARLAATALEHNIEVDYVKSLIRQRGLVPQADCVAVADWPWRFRIHAFGNFSLERDEAPDAFRGKHGRPIDLLKVAVALGAREVNVERITDALWPRIDADYAHRSFNTTLHRLRKLLEDDRAVLLQGGRLSLNDHWFWIDAWAIDRAIADAHELLRESDEFIDFDELIAVSERVVNLYRGPFMMNESTPWAGVAREGWQSKFVRCLAGVARYLIDTGRKEDAIAFLERGVEADELAEGLYRQLMLCYQRLERRAEAIEVFNRCRKTLQAQLDVEPSPETHQIYQRLLAAG